MVFPGCAGDAVGFLRGEAAGETHLAHSPPVSEIDEVTKDIATRGTQATVLVLAGHVRLDAGQELRGFQRELEGHVAIVDVDGGGTGGTGIAQRLGVVD